jgi:hypothetical protein
VSKVLFVLCDGPSLLIFNVFSSFSKTSFQIRDAGNQQAKAPILAQAKHRAEDDDRGGVGTGVSKLTF